MEQALSEAVIFLAMKFPVAMAIVVFMGSARLFFKPVMSFIHGIVEATPSKSDDAKLLVVESSKAFKAFAWLVDLLASIKLKINK
jgi:hypothetical protein